MDDVHAASSQFYTALNRMANGDASSLADVWGHDEAVTAMHPIGGRQVGFDSVMESFGKVAELASGGEIELADPLVQVAGDAACEIGVERGHFTMAGREVSIEQRVTNVYRREQDGWKMIHHHADPSPAMLDVLASL